MNKKYHPLGLTLVLLLDTGSAGAGVYWYGDHNGNYTTLEGEYIDTDYCSHASLLAAPTANQYFDFPLSWDNANCWGTLGYAPQATDIVVFGTQDSTEVRLATTINFGYTRDVNFVHNVSNQQARIFDSYIDFDLHGYTWHLIGAGSPGSGEESLQVGGLAGSLSGQDGGAASSANPEFYNGTVDAMQTVIGTKSNDNVELRLTLATLNTQGLHIGSVNNSGSGRALLQVNTGGEVNVSNSLTLGAGANSSGENILGAGSRMNTVNAELGTHTNGLGRIHVMANDTGTARLGVSGSVYLGGTSTESRGAGRLDVDGTVDIDGNLKVWNGQSHVSTNPQTNAATNDPGTIWVAGNMELVNSGMAYITTGSVGSHEFDNSVNSLIGVLGQVSVRGYPSVWETSEMYVAGLPALNILYGGQVITESTFIGDQGDSTGFITVGGTSTDGHAARLDATYSFLLRNKYGDRELSYHVLNALQIRHAHITRL
jgi:hypothetical protein